MSAIFICLIGVAVVVGGILVFRLHAFLALLLGAFVVAALTPESTLQALESTSQLTGLAEKSASSRVADGFAKGCGKVAILIALAAVIGQCLLVSGAAERIVNSLRELFGLKRAPLAFLTSGFILGIPVFFDTVFFLMIPLVRAFSRQNPGVYLLCVLSVVAGGSMAHSLVPPTPGPLLVAAELDVSLGVMIPAGLLLGMITITAGYLYARWANATFKIPMREMEMSGAESEPSEAPSLSGDRRLPPIGLALLPIVGPLFLIATATFCQALEIDIRLIQSLGEKNIAMALGAGTAMLVMVFFHQSDQTLREVVQQALFGGGVIILITAAGAAFGESLRQSGVADELAALFPQTGNAMLLVAFGLTAIVRVAQGSATVAMITSVGIIAPLAGTMELGFHPVYLALAIGCGSKPLPWMNDSGFWIIGRMAGLTEVETLKTFSVMLTVMGVAGFAVVWIASLVFPMAG